MIFINVYSHVYYHQNNILELRLCLQDMHELI